MIFRCKCGALKTAQPYRCAGEKTWICERCAPAKRSRDAMQEARDANGGRYHKYAEPVVEVRAARDKNVVIPVVTV